MPNWCNNTLIISHPDRAMMKRVIKAYNQNRLLDEFIPIPLELKEGAMNIDELRKIRNWEYKKELDAMREQLNTKYFGFKDWYDYCVSEWGTKWDVGHGDGYNTKLLKDIDKNTLHLGFDSAWSPPIRAYEKMIEMGFSIRAYYYEGGCAYCGVWEDGVDEEYSIDGKSEWVSENIPKEIDDEFCISESMAEWESENEKEEENA
jgi:hypothetical protein